MGNRPDAVTFLQWALPSLGLRWRGFRRVQAQVSKRLTRRLTELGLADLGAYRTYLADHPGEWRTLDHLCRVTISRFYRDRAIFDAVRQKLLPELAHAATERGDLQLRMWSAGAASGEEPFTLALIWRLELASRFPGMRPRIVASEVDPALVRRAEIACYPRSSIRALPREWIPIAFETTGRHDAHPGPDTYRLREEFRRDVVFRLEDIRRAAPEGPFDLVLCRNLAFTYFDVAHQRALLRAVVDRLRPGGALIIGGHERPPDAAACMLVETSRGIYRRSPGSFAPRVTSPQM